MVVTPSAHITPRGICFLGSVSSPDIPTPAINPVTAGKNKAKSDQNPRSGKFPKAGTLNTLVHQSPPKKIEIMDKMTKAKTTSWA